MFSIADMDWMMVDFLAAPSPLSIPPTMDIRMTAGDMRMYGSMYWTASSRTSPAPMMSMTRLMKTATRTDAIMEKIIPRITEFETSFAAISFSPRARRAATVVVTPAAIPRPAHIMSPYTGTMVEMAEADCAPRPDTQYVSTNWLISTTANAIRKGMIMFLIAALGSPIIFFRSSSLLIVESTCNNPYLVLLT